MSQVVCKCGAVYERTEFKLPVRDSDSASCQICGTELESWSSSRVPKFLLVKRPEKEADGN